MNKKISGMILREDIELYEKSNGLLSKGYLRQQKALDRADENLKLFAQGRLELSSRDYPTFAKYINTFADEGDKAKLFERMRYVYGFDAQASIKEQNMTHWQYTKNRYAKIIKMPKQSIKMKNLLNSAVSFVKKAKVAIVTAAVVIGGIFCLKTDSHSRTLMPKKVVKVKKTAPKKIDNKNTASFQDIQDSLQAAKYKKVYQNFYITKLEILTSAAKSKAICDKIEAQMNNGIFKLPASMGKEQVAYIDAMYKEYGLESPIAYAINAKQKLSQEQQEQLIKDLAVKDSEIKNKAKSVHGKLSNNSSFDKAGHDLQKRHIMNLKQLRDFKQKSATK